MQSSYNTMELKSSNLDKTYKFLNLKNIKKKISRKQRKFTKKKRKIILELIVIQV